MRQGSRPNAVASSSIAGSSAYIPGHSPGARIQDGTGTLSRTSACPVRIATVSARATGDRTGYTYAGHRDQRELERRPFAYLSVDRRPGRRRRQLHRGDQLTRRQHGVAVRLTIRGAGAAQAPEWFWDARPVTCTQESSAVSASLASCWPR